MNSVAENAMRGRRSMLMSEEFAESQNRDEMNRQLKARIEEDELLHAEHTTTRWR